MRLRRHTELSEESGIDLAPMLDFIMNLLIFFIITAAVVKESGVEVNRPDSATATKQDKANIMIGIDSSGDIWINRRRVDVDSVRANIEALRAENPKGTIVIQADEVAQAKQIMAVMDAARQAGVYEIALAGKPTQ
ncbi:MAG TPA: biopolymer transporter ExbD [Nevskiaceae bacterium]|nr:biopolymer transporter ExbD [Nevskiaceae bacterium]